jgi:hypothetical protein
MSKEQPRRQSARQTSSLADTVKARGRGGSWPSPPLLLEGETRCLIVDRLTRPWYMIGSSFSSFWVKYL